MKKLLLTLMGALALFAMVACSQNPDDSTKDDKNSGNKTENTDSSGNDGTDKDDKDNTGDGDGKQVPVIRITTTNPKDPAKPLAFVTDPISDSVKLHSHSWGDYSKDSIPAPWYEQCTITVTDEEKAEVLTDINAQVKTRGNWTTSYDKKGLRIKFEKKQSMLGLHDGEKYKNWVLLAEWKDLSMLRDYTAQKLARLMSSDYYASDTKLVEVYINDTYWGVYLLAEQQEDKRVGITEAKEGDGVTETGYLLEYDVYAQYSDGGTLNGESVEQDFVKIDGYGKYTDVNGEEGPEGCKYYTIKSDYDDDKKAFIKPYIQTVWDICREAIENGKYYKFDSTYNAKVESTAKTAEECIAEVVDIDSLVNAYIIAELACDLDLNWSSFYMDVDFGPEGNKKLTFEAPWDFDSCFGNVKKCEFDSIITHLYAASNYTEDDANRRYAQGNPWTIIFAKETWFQDKVRAKWSAMNKAGIKNKLVSDINSISNSSLYAAAFKRNYDKWENIGANSNDEICDDARACKTQKEAADVFVSKLNWRWTVLDADFKTFKTTNQPVGYDATLSKVFKKDDGTTVGNVQVKISAKADGLHIEKSVPDYFNQIGVSVVDTSINKRLFSIDNVDGRDGNDKHKVKDVKNTFVYPYVEANHFYEVILSGYHVDEKGNYTDYNHISLKVKAKGGSGDAYVSFDSHIFNPADASITFVNYSEALQGMQMDIDSRNATLFNGSLWENEVSWNGRWEKDSANPNKIILKDRKWGPDRLEAYEAGALNNVQSGNILYEYKDSVSKLVYQGSIISGDLNK